MFEKYLGKVYGTGKKLVICSPDIAQMILKQRRNEQIGDQVKPTDQ